MLASCIKLIQDIAGIGSRRVDIKRQRSGRVLILLYHYQSDYHLCARTDWGRTSIGTVGLSVWISRLSSGDFIHKITYLGSPDYWWQPESYKESLMSHFSLMLNTEKVHFRNWLQPFQLLHLWAIKEPQLKGHYRSSFQNSGIDILFITCLFTYLRSQI